MTFNCNSECELKFPLSWLSSCVGRSCPAGSLLMSSYTSGDEVTQIVGLPRPSDAFHRIRRRSSLPRPVLTSATMVTSTVKQANIERVSKVP